MPTGRVNILYLLPVDKPTACELVRAIIPAEILRRNGHRADVVNLTDAFDTLRTNTSLLGRYDLIQMMRVVSDHPLEKWVTEAPWLLRNCGPAVIADYDDDFTNEHREIHPGWLELNAFSAVTVSTPYLKRTMGKYHKDIHVLPNAIMPEMFGYTRFKRVFPKEWLIFGLTGSFTHNRDWEVVIEPIKEVLAQIPHARIFVSGYMPPALLGHPQLLTLRDIDPNQPEDVYNRFLPFNQYPGIYQNIDVTLCPVDDKDGFNHGKSNLKALESFAASRILSTGQIGGAAVIATGGRLPIYQDAVIHGKTGLLVEYSDQQTWADAMLKMASFSELRETLQARGYEHCMSHFTAQARLAERVSTYEAILKQERRSKQKVAARVAALAED